MGTINKSCLVCGEPIVYSNQTANMICNECHNQVSSNAKCRNGHFICDACHNAKSLLAIQNECKKNTSKNPLAIAMELMENPAICMHGPEHHVLTGAALITAYHNSGGNIDLISSLKEMEKRGHAVPGGICGFWGSCGAAISAGIFVSIITKSTPLSIDSWGLCNRMTAASLENMGVIGGPRCCKRNSFISIKTAVVFAEKYLGVKMQLPNDIKCTHFSKNNECLASKCPFFDN